MSPDEFLQGRAWVRSDRAVTAATLVRRLTVHMENPYLSSPGAFSKKQVFGSLIRSLASADTSAFRKSLLCCDFPDKDAPGARRLHRLLSRHPPAGGPGVGDVVVNPSRLEFSTSLILTAKSQPGLLALITRIPQRLPCPLGSSGRRLSGCFAITDMGLEDYLLTLEGSCLCAFADKCSSVC